MATGRCVIVSETGMQATLKPSPDIWVTGSLTAELEVRSISLKARVIRVDDEGTTFSFRVTTERERHELNLLLAAAMERGKLIPHEE